METFSATDPQRPVTRSFDVFFDLRLNKRLSKQPWGWWFETPPWSLWRQCNEDLNAGGSRFGREITLLLNDMACFDNPLLINLWQYICPRHLGPSQYKKCHLTSIVIPMLKIGRSRDRLTFNMGIPIDVPTYMGKTVFILWRGAKLGMFTIVFCIHHFDWCIKKC